MCGEGGEQGALGWGLGGWRGGAKATEGIGVGAGEGRCEADSTMAEASKEEEKRRGGGRIHGQNCPKRQISDFLFNFVANYQAQ